MNESYPNIRDGRKTVTTAGTAVKLVATNTRASKVEITALESNTDVVVVGDSTVVAGTTGDGAHTRRGTPLMVGQSMTLFLEDLSTIYLDAVVSGEGVSYAYYF